jgi:phospholipase/carboxylesterase
MTGLLETVERATGSPAEVQASVIWFHGLGADGHDFEPIVPELALDELPLRFVFPHAPIRPVTINAGMTMRAWFDVIGLDRRSPQDEPGIRESEAQARALIARENERGIPCSRIVLAGFSQGGAVALHTALRYPERLAGVIGLSTFLPLQHRLDAEASEANRGLPAFIAHGTQDPLVVPALGEATRDALVARGHAVEWKTYPMPHAVCAEEIEDIRDWLGRTLRG